MRIFTSILFSFFILSSIAQNDTERLMAAMLGETPIEEDLQELCDEIGGRVTGSEANEKSVEWGCRKFKEAKVKVRKQAFEMPVLWLPESTKAKVSGAAEFVPSIVAKYQTPPGNYKAKLVDAGTGTEEEVKKLGASVKDNFLLVEMDLCLDIPGLFAEYEAATKAEMAAEKYGARGIVFMASRPRGLLYRFITHKATDNTMPQFVMVREDAKRCLRTIREGKPLDIEISISAKTGDSFKSENVIAEIKGSEKPDEVVIIGAHLDSWAMGTGANDNGCNVAMMIDIARQMKKLGIKPKRTIRFALWNGEEQGYFGSWAYNKEQGDKLDKHIMALSIDIGSGALSGFFTNGREELIPILEEVLQPVEGLGDFTHLNVPIVGTDNFDFMLEGVPNLVGNHLSASYGINYHASSDTFDKVDLKSLKRNSAIVAVLTLGFANLDENKYPLQRQSREEIQAIFDKNKLEFTMRMFNVWEPWISRARGRVE